MMFFIPLKTEALSKFLSQTKELLLRTEEAFLTDLPTEKNNREKENA